MKYFSISFDSTENQPKIIDQLKSNGFEVIQGANGLYAKGSKVPNMDGLRLKILDRSKLMNDQKIPQDLRAFLK